MKLFWIFLCFFSLILSLNASDKININFKDLKIMELVKITAKIIDKNILITDKINGNVDFISTKPLEKKQLVKILTYVLESKNYTLISSGNILRIVKINKALENKNKIIEVIKLKNIEAKNIHKIINNIIEKKIYTNPSKKLLSSIDEESNSIVLMGLSDDINYIKLLLKELDKEKLQVYVLAKIIEVNNELVNEIGLSYGLFAGTSSNNTLATFSSKLNGGSNSLSTVKSFLGLDLGDVTSGLALGASLNLLKQDGALNIVSEPSILAINNMESSIYVGETISIKTSSSVTSDGKTTNENFKREDVGLILKVKPRISNDKKVTLEINAILEGVKTTLTSSGNADTSKKEIKTTAILSNGESVIIGGLIENKTESTNQKVPVLGDIPFLGSLFRNKSFYKKKNNLVIIITPYLIPKTKNITFIRNQLSQLKLLEDRYLQDSLLRLKEKQIVFLNDKNNYSKKLKNLDNKINLIKNKRLNVDHEKRVAEILGY